MSLINRKNNLSALLVTKGASLRAKEEREANAAVAHSQAASNALTTSAVAAKHAEAVEQALQVLQDAGVDL